MTKKVRIPITPEQSARILFDSDRTCCVCQENGKRVQIHHIDENPSNNSDNNLSLLCFECHDQTQIRGGFGKQLTPAVVIKYQTDWLERVKTRRLQADEFALSKMTGNNVTYRSQKTLDSSNDRVPTSIDGLYDFLDSLPIVKNALYAKAQPGWDTGVTGEMVDASNGYIDGLQGILVGLLNFYDNSCFESQDPHEFLSEVISSRFHWHRIQLEPSGPNTGGTIVKVTILGAIANDLETMVTDVVVSLIGYDQAYSYDRWKVQWEGKDIYK